MPVASGGIHAGQMHQLLHYLAMTWFCNSAVARLGTRMVFRLGQLPTVLLWSHDPST